MKIKMNQLTEKHLVMVKILLHFAMEICINLLIYQLYVYLIPIYHPHIIRYMMLIVLFGTLGYSITIIFTRPRSSILQEKVANIEQNLSKMKEQLDRIEKTMVKIKINQLVVPQEPILPSINLSSIQILRHLSTTKPTRIHQEENSNLDKPERRYDSILEF